MNSEKPMFSVVIPLYNKEDTISATLQSVLNQSYTGFEVIVVDDGSTDKSAHVVRAFSDPRLKIFSKKNGGVSEARNFGIDRAQYEYIAFLDADDFWEHNYLEEMAALITRYPAAAMYSAAYKVLSKAKVIIACQGLAEGLIEDFFEMRMKHHIFRTSVTVVQKKAIVQVGGFPVGMIAGEDDFTFSKIAIQQKAAFTPRVLGTYNSADSSYMFRKGKIDFCKESWLDLYQEGDFYRNEFIALKAITAGIRYAFGKPKAKSRKIEELTKYTTLFQKEWKYLHFLNRIPYPGGLIWKVARAHYKTVRFWLARHRRKMIEGASYRFG